MKYMIKLALSFLLERLVEVRFKCITCVSQLKKEKRKRKEKEILNDSTSKIHMDGNFVSLTDF